MSNHTALVMSGIGIMVLIVMLGIVVNEVYRGSDPIPVTVNVLTADQPAQTDAGTDTWCKGLTTNLTFYEAVGKPGARVTGGASPGTANTVTDKCIIYSSSGTRPLYLVIPLILVGALLVAAAGWGIYRMRR